MLRPSAGTFTIPVEQRGESPHIVYGPSPMLRYMEALIAIAAIPKMVPAMT
jgi:hypothetical protein